MTTEEHLRVAKTAKRQKMKKSGIKARPIKNGGERGLHIFL